MNRRKIYPADALSFLRALAALPFFYFVWKEEWTAAFFTLGLGWATDLLDGIAASKWGCLRNRYPNLDLDGIADTVLAIGSTGTLAYYAGRHYGYGSWAFDAVLILTLTCMMMGALMVGFLAKAGETPVTPMHRTIVGGYMIIGHAILQIGAPLVWLAYMAGGMFDAGALTLVLLGIAVLQHKKIVLWNGGRLR